MTILDAFDLWRRDNPAIDQANRDAVAEQRANDQRVERLKRALRSPMPPRKKERREENV